MAQLHTQKIIITLSVAVKQSDKAIHPDLLSDERKEELAQVIEGLLENPAIIVEIE